MMRCQWSCLLYLIYVTVHGIAIAIPDACPYHCRCGKESLECSNGHLLDRSAFKRFTPELKSIAVNDFVLRELSAHQFKQYTFLEALRITESRLQTLDKSCFAGLSQLKMLNLTGNHLETLPEHLFKDVNSLEQLSLAHNLLNELPIKLFHNTTRYLHSLNLSHNRLRLLGAEIFDSLTRLENLDLSHNELTYILPSTFNVLGNLHFIDLNSNLLVTLHNDLLNTTGAVQLSVAQNPFVCNCGLVWLREVLLGNAPLIELANTSDVLCSAPHIFRGSRLTEVPLEHLHCSNPTAKVFQSEGPHYYRNQVSNQLNSYSLLVQRSTLLSIPYQLCCTLMFPCCNTAAMLSPSTVCCVQVQIRCVVSGNPTPSVVWKTPTGDSLSDPERGQWLDSSVDDMSASKVYQVQATGERVDFAVRYVTALSPLSIHSDSSQLLDTK